MSRASFSGRSVIVWLATLLLLTTRASAAVIGTVVGVHDGDTLTLLTSGKTEVKVRLEGIDAPETKQPFGSAAKKALSDMVYGKMVRLEETGKDRYGRILGDIHAGDVWVNSVLVERGLAWHFEKYSKDQRLMLAQQKARRLKIGLWQDREPVPPWEWRKKK